MATLFLFLGLLSFLPQAPARELVPIVVELETMEPCAVAMHEALAAGEPFDRTSYEARVLAEQHDFLAALDAAGIAHRVTTTRLNLPTGPFDKPDHFVFLINAVGLEVPASAVARIRQMPGVERVTPDEPFRLHLDESVEYVRASDGPGNKTIFSQAGGPLTRFDGAGQVIAILDTGIEHTHPAFDTRFDDADFESRTGDPRPVRLAGEAYEEGTHHPKVVYFLALTGSTNEDDVGHGTHCGADSAGLKVRGPGLDRLSGTADDQIIEGVAPGALLMNYKVCETLFTCVGTTNIVTALEDALSPTDPLGNPKPVATVINMSFGGGSGDPNAPSSVASDNAALLGAVVVSSAGNSGPGERTLGAPAAARRVIAVAATNDPGSVVNEVDVMTPNPLRYGVASSTGGQDDSGQPVAPEDLPIKATILAGAPDVTFPLGQHYVYVGFSDTPGQVPDEVDGRIALALRGSTADVGVSGTGAFGNKAAQAAAKGAIALLVMNNEPGELEAATAVAATIPVYGVSQANGQYLRDTLDFQSPLFDPENSATWDTISSFPIRIVPPDPLNFDPATTGFSSRGPITLSRYVKPDVTAPGLNVYAATIPAGGVSTGGGTMSDPSRFISVSGTSFSGPHVAGAAALVREALLSARGEAPIPAAALRSGAAAAQQLTQTLVVPQSIVRNALTNTATNLRRSDGTPLADTDARVLVHEVGAGLLHVVEAVDARAAFGTNERNGTGGPDDADDPDFLPTYSFGDREVIDTGDSSQIDTITVTLENVAGASAAGTYGLSLVDAGSTFGDVTRPISGTNGFQVSLSSPAVTLGPNVGDQAVFDVTVEVDGRPAPQGLAVAGQDTGGIFATEFLWHVRAAAGNGEELRMPFSYRAVRQAPDPAQAQPFLLAIEDDARPDQTPDGRDRDGSYRLSWTYPDEGAEQPCAFVVEEARTSMGLFSDDAEEVLVNGSNSTWDGDPTWTSAAHPTTGTNSYSPAYVDLQDVSLTQIAAISLPPSSRPTLSFESFEDIEPDFDFAFVEASGDGGPFIPLAAYTGSFSGTRNVDLSGFAGQDVRVRFRFVTDCIVSAPLFLGWFIDDIRIEAADFETIATVSGSTFSFDVKDRLGTANGKGALLGVQRYLYRVGGIFGGSCTKAGPYSNVREITVDRRRGLQPTSF